MDLIRNSPPLSSSRRRAPFSLSLSLSLSTRRERGDVGEVGEGKVEGKIGSLTLVTLFFSLSKECCYHHFRRRHHQRERRLRMVVQKATEDEEVWFTRHHLRHHHHPQTRKNY